MSTLLDMPIIDTQKLRTNIMYDKYGEKGKNIFMGGEGVLL